MSVKSGLVVGCVVVLLLGGAALAGCIGCLVYASQDIEGATVDIAVPDRIVAGEEFEMTVTVTNTRQQKALSVGDIDMAHSFLNGFNVLKVTPGPKAENHVPVMDMQSWTFGQEIPAGQAQTFTWKMRAGETPGIYRGQLQVYEGMRTLSRMVSAEILAAE